MTPEEIIEVVQAYIDGKTIQCRGTGVDGLEFWTLATQPLWDFEFFEYRVKPEPREWWAVDYDAVWPTIYETKERAIEMAEGRPVIKVREVIE